jgi:hypothetical protein
MQGSAEFFDPLTRTVPEEGIAAANDKFVHRRPFRLNAMSRKVMRAEDRNESGGPIQIERVPRMVLDPETWVLAKR